MRHSICNESAVEAQQRFKLLRHPKDMEELKVRVNVWRLFHEIHDFLDEPGRVLTPAAT
jgi:hypothetical protein